MIKIINSLLILICSKTLTVNPGDSIGKIEEKIIYYRDEDRFIELVLKTYRENINAVMTGLIYKNINTEIVNDSIEIARIRFIECLQAHNKIAVFEIRDNNSSFVLKRCQTEDEKIIFGFIFKEEYKHDNILNAIGIYKESFINNNEHLFIHWILMEKCEEIDLNIFIGNLDNLRKICLEILSGLNHLHKMKIAHLDIKIDNIMIADDGKYKIIDFNLSKFIKNKGINLSFHKYGTKGYFAPEIYNKKKACLKSDIWSFGMTVYYLFIGKETIYKDEINDRVSNRHYISYLKRFLFLKNHRNLLFPTDTDSNFKDFVNRCLDPNMNSRPNADELLKHKFLNKD